jgi:hypothetical protein
MTMKVSVGLASVDYISFKELRRYLNPNLITSTETIARFYIY